MKPPSNNLIVGAGAVLVGELLSWGEGELATSSHSARLDSEVLLSYVLGLSRSGLLARLRDVCPVEAWERFIGLIERRRRGEPVAYIVGEREFFGLSFVVTPDVLVPRPESELLVEEALRALQGKSEVRVLDLGTGSGCLAISIVRELKRKGISQVQCDALDRCPKALEVARSNAERLGVAGEVSLMCGDWSSASLALSPGYDCIIANPPYIDPGEDVPRELTFEPAGALFSEEGGLSDTAVILQKGIPLLKPGAVLLCEVGAGKRASLRRLLSQYDSACEISLLGDDSSQDTFCVVRVRP